MQQFNACKHGEDNLLKFNLSIVVVCTRLA